MNDRELNPQQTPSPFRWRDPDFQPFINWSKFYRMDLRSATATKARERLEAEGKESNIQISNPRKKK